LFFEDYLRFLMHDLFTGFTHRKWAGLAKDQKGDFERKLLQDSGSALVKPFGRSSENLWVQVHEREPASRSTQICLSRSAADENAAGVLVARPSAVG
jgi:hypothetical protein